MLWVRNAGQLWTKRYTSPCPPSCHSQHHRAPRAPPDPALPLPYFSRPVASLCLGSVEMMPRLMPPSPPVDAVQPFPSSSFTPFPPAPPPLRPPCHPPGVLGIIAGGVALDALGSTLRNGNMLCAFGTLAGGTVCILAFTLTQTFSSFLTVFALGQLGIFVLQVRPLRSTLVALCARERPM